MRWSEHTMTSCGTVQVLQQALVALRLRHPNIETVIGTSVDPPTRDLLLVTALLERGTLYDLLHNDTVSCLQCTGTVQGQALLAALCIALTSL